MDQQPEYTITNPQLIERVTWLILCVALITVPFIGLLLDAPPHWYVCAVAYLLLVKNRMNIR